MKSSRAAALRLIRPWLSRAAIVEDRRTDVFGSDGLVVGVFLTRTVARGVDILGVRTELLGDDDDLLDERDEEGRPPFWGSAWSTTEQSAIRNSASIRRMGSSVDSGC
jgi:hypothetical protein